MKTDFTKGIVFALGAAALNATIGVFSKILMSNGFTASSVAVIKTILGFLLLSALLPALKRPTSRSSWLQCATCAFLGIFILFYFETSAYHHYATAGVVVILMASASISSIILGRLVLKDAITANAMIGAGFSITGIVLIFGNDLNQGFTVQGAMLATIAGSGYGAFSVLMKKTGAAGGLHLTRRLLFFGALYLLVPATADGFVIGTLSPVVVASLLALAVFPTILGFFCTTKALDHLKPFQVQALELTEPLFAAVLAFVVLHEVPPESLYAGAALILIGLCFSSGLIKSGKRNPVTPPST